LANIIDLKCNKSEMLDYWINVMNIIEEYREEDGVSA
jgi:hypothetical protein